MDTLRVLARIEAQNDTIARNVAALRVGVQTNRKEHDDRIDAVELEMPLARQARGGITEALKYVLIAVGAGLLELVGLDQ